MVNMQLNLDFRKGDESISFFDLEQERIDI